MANLRTQRRRANGRRDDGASLVEFALIAPLLFALLLGMMTGGLALSRKNSLENAVREGGRLGATLQEDADWANAVRSRVVRLAGGDLESDQVCVKLIRKATATTETPRRSTSCPPGLTAAEPSAAEVPVGHCVVKVWAERSSEFEVIFFRTDVTLSSDSINRFERTGSPATCGT